MTLHKTTIVTLLLSLGTAFCLAEPAEAQRRAASDSRPAAPVRAAAPAAVPIRAGQHEAVSLAPARLDPAIVRERVRLAIESGARDTAVTRRLRERLLTRDLSGSSPTRELRGLDAAQREVVIEAARAARAVLARARADALEVRAHYDASASTDPTIVRAASGSGREFEELRQLRQAVRAELDAIAQRVLAVLTPAQVQGFEQRLAARGIEPTADRVLHRIGMLLLMPDTIRVLEKARSVASDAGAAPRIRARAPEAPARSSATAR